MKEVLKKIFGNLLTGRDNDTHDIGRWSWFITLLSLMIGAGYNGYMQGSVDLMVLAQAMAIIVGAHGAALFMKKDSEPDTKKE